MLVQHIHVSSNSLPFTQRTWRHTYCGGMKGLFEKCWTTTWSTPPLWIIIPYCGKGPNMEGRTWLVTFKQNHAKLAWAFINIMNVIHHSRILHNDLSKDNIMLQILPNKLDVVYMGMCNWGEVGTCKRWYHHCMGLQRSKMPPMQKKCIGGLPHIYFCYNELRTSNSLQRMAKQHATTLRLKHI
jgi:serine/threonine protein kinase